MRILTWIILIVAFTSCKKDPGVGGLNTLTGKVNAVYVKLGSFDTLSVGPVADQRVYIVYGTGATHDNDTRTSPDGSFKFEYLHPGDYGVYTYSDNLLAPDEKEAVWKSINLPKGQNTRSIGEFTVIKYVD